MTEGSPIPTNIRLAFNPHPGLPVTAQTEDPRDFLEESPNPLARMAEDLSRRMRDGTGWEVDGYED
jgi:hypothetical protein